MNFNRFLVSNVAVRLMKKEEKAGKESLNRVERAIVYISHSEGLIGNGGFDYFLLWEDADECLCDLFDDISAHDISQILRALFNLLPEVRKGMSTEKREVALRKALRTRRKDLAALEARFYELKEALTPKLADYIKTNWDEIEESIDSYYVFW